MNVEIEQTNVVDRCETAGNVVTLLNMPEQRTQESSDIGIYHDIIELGMLSTNRSAESSIVNTMATTESQDEAKNETNFTTLKAMIATNYHKYSPTNFLHNLQENVFIDSFIYMMLWFCSIVVITTVLNNLLELSIGLLFIVLSILIPKVILLPFNNPNKKRIYLFILDIFFVLFLKTGIIFLCLQDYKKQYKPEINNPK
ncbi:hypothetical protein CWI36_0400p0010 [Hamiltosporidium magnivora]|uniref:Uncharacterized protein n=1 Tax=Hamiltosporidium magnivora TaxID=148818 RepID=A0A4V2JW55_9MICR|nr:hypothetical protein CWI36_0400p0010 [Hamiltosporidium magnivora]